ncbi:MAG: hypothetical protein NVV60_14270 [Luteimonas sp.]|nr:hypothetical protein [Luteimonas sp.]
MFDLRRFLRLGAVHWAEHGRGYLWFLGIGVAVHLCVWLLITDAGMKAWNYAVELQAIVYVMGYLLTGTLFAGRYFSGLSRRESALIWLMRPASTFEKFVLAFLVVAVLYPLAYTVAFQVCNLPGAWLGAIARDAEVARLAAEAEANGAGMVPYMRAMEYGPYVPLLDPKKHALELNLFLGGLSVQGLILAGMLLFRCLAWLKTLVALFVLWLGLALLAGVIGASPSNLFWGENAHVQSALLRTWLWLLWLGVPALFWLAALFLLREREVQ